MNKLITCLLLIVALLNCNRIFAQNTIINKTVTYEELYDDPNDINKLFFQVLPLYGEFFRTNINAGFGVKADYYLKNKAEFSAQFRKPYSRKTDFVRDNARENNDFENSPKTFYYLDVGGAYHIVDKVVDGKAKFILYSKNFQEGNKWESMEHENIQAPVKVRRVYGIRAGATYYQTALDIKDITQSQKTAILDTAGNSLPSILHAFGNMTAAGVYLGGVMEIIKNVAIKFDKTYDPVTNDLLFTAYMDLCYYPAITVDNLFYRSSSGNSDVTYSSDVIKTNPFGFKMGIEGKFNRDLSWGYGIETGIRPGISKQGFFLEGHVSFPIIASKLTSEVEAFGK